MVESKLVSILQNNQKGQGMIEYVLLLVITTSMILLAMANLFKPMQDFMKNYMGTYVACLLSSGELPAIRTENSLSDAEPKCNFGLVKGTASFTHNGTGGTGGSGGPGSNGNPNGKNGDGTSGTGKDGKNGRGSGANGSGSGDNANGSGDGSGSGNSYAGSNSRRSGFGNSAFLKRSSDSGLSDDGGAGSGGQKRYVNNLDRNKNDRFFRNQQQTQRVGVNNGRGVYISGMTIEDQQKIERKVQSEPRVVPKSSEEFSVPGKKSVLKPPPPKASKKIEDKEESFTVGSFLKYILIAIIILLILILGGGQAFEMSKTMD
jgi:hypothetical protein